MWEYDINSHTIKHNGKPITSHAYAGAPGFKNDASKISVSNKGPLPVGTYTIGAPYHNRHTGLYTLNLTPAAGNVMYGRNLFRIHGDSVSHPGEASDGCIITDLSVRQQIWNSQDHVIKVVQ
ncbi:tlde1 domain-containing protein [Mangrovibacter yixingensis]|uniref:tlde1 domain-containing protein n=1 Tax=Mangrovibacter yixingensis TaxID=1529639 RepID=UPI001CFD423C|nr:tlde1 domain-containing protein [Mangrovibacter yixingensis]